MDSGPPNDKAHNGSSGANLNYYSLQIKLAIVNCQILKGGAILFLEFHA
jgi:hypothetical protein